jgi:hypothetical protein
VAAAREIAATLMIRRRKAETEPALSGSPSGHYDRHILQNAGLPGKADKRTLRGLQWLLAVESRMARSQNRLVNQIAAIQWPLVKKVDRIRNPGNLFYGILFAFHEHWGIEQSIVHHFLEVHSWVDAGLVAADKDVAPWPSRQPGCS